MSTTTPDILTPLADRIVIPPAPTTEPSHRFVNRQVFSQVDHMIGMTPPFDDPRDMAEVSSFEVVHQATFRELAAAYLNMEDIRDARQILLRRGHCFSFGQVEDTLWGALTGHDPMQFRMEQPSVHFFPTKTSPGCMSMIQAQLINSLWRVDLLQFGVNTKVVMPKRQTISFLDVPTRF